MTENWRPIPGYEGLYDVSDHGNVRSWSTYRGMSAPHGVKTSLNHHGYPRLTLYRDGKRDYRTVHSLVALAFIGPRPEGQEVRHLNGDESNPRLTNLAYGTKTENQMDIIRHGRHPHANKTHCKRGHQFTPENAWRTPAGHRQCRPCQAIRQRERRAALLRPAATTDTPRRKVAA